ncbi:MAG: hypothetical protein ACKVRP_04600 [Bacteroidota bacterium]
MKSLRTLLNGLIDYAGLFPPAKLDMASAVKNYAKYTASGRSWALGRFIVPMSRLAEFELATDVLPATGQPQPWRLSVLGGSDIESEKDEIVHFNIRHADHESRPIIIDTVELKASSASAVELAARMHGNDVSLFLEIPITDDPSGLISAIRQSGAKAKVRTGGVTADAFPSNKDLARFIHACAKERVMFKATAGLHHPIHSEYSLTYEKESPKGIMHGFINVFLAAAFAHNGMGPTEIERLLLEQDPTAFVFTDENVSWRENMLSVYQVNAARAGLALAFGSCSFTEPFDDLRTLGFL